MGSCDITSCVPYCFLCDQANICRNIWLVWHRLIPEISLIRWFVGVSAVMWSTCWGCRAASRPDPGIMMSSVFTSKQQWLRPLAQLTVTSPVCAEDLWPVSVPVAFCLSNVFIVLCSKQEVTSVWEFCLCAASTTTNSAVSANVNKDVATSSLTFSCFLSSWSHVCSASVCCPRRSDQQEVQRRKGELWVL